MLKQKLSQEFRNIQKRFQIYCLNQHLKRTTTYNIPIKNGLKSVFEAEKRNFDCKCILKLIKLNNVH